MNLYPVNNTELRHLKEHGGVLYNVIRTRSWKRNFIIRFYNHFHFYFSWYFAGAHIWWIKFFELAERPLMSPLAGTNHTHVRLGIVIFLYFLLRFISKKFLVCVRLWMWWPNGSTFFVFTSSIPQQIVFLVQISCSKANVKATCTLYI